MALALRHHTKMSEGEIHDRVSESLQAVGLHDPDRAGQSSDDIGKRMPSDLSGGMRKRVGLARALATRPRYMLYDEPTTGLDPIMSGIIDNLIRSLNEQFDTTSLTITHDMNSAFTIADRIVMLHRGRIVYSGTVDQIRELSERPREKLETEEEMVVHQFINGDHEGLIQPAPTDHYEKTRAHQ
jgi:phospholipid/cholesterol/gamma-HCH transport system ATP-binding protein